MTCSETIILVVLGLCLLGSLNGDVFFSVKEDAQNGTVVGSLTCTENLSLDDYQKHWFELRHNASEVAWEILVGRGFRSISGSSVVMSYSCGSVQKLTFTVHLEPVNKHPPQFCNNSLVDLHVPENTTLGQDLYSFQICDHDRRVLFGSFTLEPSTHFKLVRVDTAIKLQLSEKLDYDAVNTTHVLNYIVSVMDDNQTHSPDKIQLRVYVDDVDDQSPAFSLPLYKCEIPEGTYTSYQFSCSVKAEDQDKGLHTSLDYSIISVLPSTDIFSIDNSGILTATGFLDRENISSYSLVVKGFQLNRPVDRYNFTTVKIEVKDIDDNSPIMSSTSYSASIMENTANGVAVLQVAASDADLGEFGKFVFVLNDTSKAFTINETTGLISVRNTTALDYEKVHPPKFDMTVYAQATKGKRHSAPSYVTITLLDVNDNDPLFRKDLYSFHISKNYSIGSIVGRVNAIDADTDVNITYYVVPQTSTLFAVNGKTGVVTVSGNLSDSCIRVYKLTVMAEDGPATLTSVRRSSVPVTVYVKDVNMFPPVFDSHLYGLVLNISEATTVGTNILEFKATDKDLCDNLNYSVSAGDSESQFDLQNQRLYVVKALDREDIPNYILTVYVTDGDNNDTATITINVMDENDNDPVFENNAYTFNVTEEQPGGVVVGNIRATDRDEGMNSAILYELEDGSWSNNFTIENSTGNISTKGKLDREELLISDVIKLVVIATDRGSPPRRSRTIVTVTVLDVNDNKPFFIHKNVNITLLEGFEPGILYQAKAYDKDSGRNKFVLYKKRFYPLAPTPSYIKVADNGTVYTTRTLTINKNGTNDHIHVIIEANNDGLKGRPVRQHLLILLKDVNDHSPRFLNQSVIVSLKEDHLPGTVIRRILAKDDDFTPEYNTVTYWLHPPQTHFIIDSSTGDIYLTAPLDYENRTKYELNKKRWEDNIKEWTGIDFASSTRAAENRTRCKGIVVDSSVVPRRPSKVYASDMKPFVKNATIMNVSLPVTVNIEDVNDNAPVFSEDIFNCSLIEGELLKNCEVTATDEDRGEFGNVTYSILSNSNSWFKIDSKTGRIRTEQKLDYETSSHLFILLVAATDKGSPPLNTHCQVMIQLENINDEKPVFLNKPYDFSLYENTKPNRSGVGEIFVSDKDGDDVTVRILEDQDDFRLSDKLALIPLKYFDFENLAKKMISITLVASDTVHTTTANVTIRILDRNDEAPTFLNKTYSVTVEENVTSHSAVLQVSAFDPDSSQNGNNIVTYCILEGAMGMFEINNSSGWITTTKSLNASIRQNYHLIVQAADNGTPSQLSISMVDVHINDVNDLWPWFLYTPYIATVAENKDTSLLQVYGKDPDPSTATLKFDVVSEKIKRYFWFTDNTLHVTGLDAETTGDTVEVTISLSDDVHIVYTNVTVSVVDVNDNAPYFKDTPYVATVADTASKETKILHIKAEDKDITDASLTYILYGALGDFTVNRTSGIIRVADHAVLSFSRKPTYTMTVLVQDSGSPPKTNATSVIVYVNETNESPPVFQNLPFIFSFPENNQSVSAKITALDKDGVTYSISEDNSDNLFSIDNITGIIKLYNGSLNFERDEGFTFIVQAKDRAAFPKSSSATVTIKVVDVNEAPTLMIKTHNVYKEIQSTSGEVIKIESSDPDTKSEKFRNLTYSLRESDEKFFSIDKNTGSITLNGTLYKPGNFSVEVVVTDGEGLSDSGLVFVIVSNITGYSLNTSVQENRPICSFVYDLRNATSSQPGLTFNLLFQNGSEKFAVNDSAIVVTNGVLNREEKAYFHLVFNGKDPVNRIMKAQIQLYVTVQDVNDNPPVFNSSRYDLSVLEESAPGTIVGIVTATDIDADAKLSYSTNSTVFNISNTGVITTLKPLNRENREIFHIQVTCSDGSFSSTSNVYIRLLDINDNGPHFVTAVYSARILESQSVGTLPNLQLSANDSDAEFAMLHYTIISGNVGNHFSVNTDTGTFELLKELDYETMAEFNLSVKVTDGLYNDTAKVHITVIDVNDNEPKFCRSVYTFSTKEGPSSVNQSFVVEATDADSGNNSLLSYSFQTDGPNGINSNFEITTVNRMGIIRILSSLDRENILLPHENRTGSAFYTFTVIVKDQGEPRKSDTAKVTVFVTDINDCSPTFTNPEFSNPNYSLPVQESTPVRSSLLRLTTTDCDYYSNYTTVSYQLHGNGSEYFGVDKDGEVTLEKRVIATDRFNLVISASDGENIINASLKITVVDANNHPPVFSDKNYAFSISENVSGLKVIGYVSATDGDLGDNGRVTYNITSGDGKHLFTVDPKNGSIILTGNLDRERKDTYTLFILAEDNAKIDRLQGTSEVRITVTDENDNSPVFNPSAKYSCSVKEDSANGTVLKVIPKINATDDDTKDNGTAGIRYSLIGNSSHLFCIDPITAVITLCHAGLDRETTPHYVLKVLAIDRNGSSDGQQTMATVDITVLDVNDNTPQFIGTYEFNVSEDINTTSSIGQVAVSDADLPGSNKLRFSITSGGMGKFYIDSVKGTIHVSGHLDRETRDIFHLIVTASDGKHSNRTDVTVIIQDVNDNSPLFNKSVVDVGVTEAQQPPIVIMTAEAYDWDKSNTENSHISYYLENNNETKIFTMYENGTLSTLKPLDREKKGIHMLTIIAKDNGSPQLSSTQTVRITVLDVNDNRPLFCNESDCVTDVKQIPSVIVEKSPVGSVVALLVAKDKDHGSNGTVRYSIEGDIRKTRFFKINTDTGLVTLRLPVDINLLVNDGLILKNETETAALAVTVKATDLGSPVPLSNTISLIVSIVGINDDAPVFKMPVFPFTIPEDFNIGSVVGQTGAIVSNTSYTHLKYLKVSAAGTEHFDIIKTSGEVTLVRPLDREIESFYTFPIAVRDGGFPERTAFAIVEVNVTDINDNNPEFHQDMYAFAVPEEETSTGFMNISATDKDEGENAELVYSLLDDFGDLLSINNVTGLVSLKRTLDRETNQTLLYTVLVTDGGTPNRSRRTNVTVIVLDMNDNSPSFVDTPSVVNLTENDITEYFQVHAVDPDAGQNGTVIYEIDANSGPFQINPFSGMITLLEPTDFEKIPQYNLTIVAFDQGNPCQSTAINITVYIKDVYDFVPVCEPEVTEISIMSSVSASAQIAQVDAGHGSLRYSLTGGPGAFFYVDKISGTVRVKRQLDRHTKQYELSVTATDQISNKTAICKVIVHIQDSFVSFPSLTYNTSISENLDLTNGPLLLIDLNSTEETMDFNVIYSLSKTSWRDKFWVDPHSGKVYCNSSLDRETKEIYELFVSGQTTVPRRKREVQEPTTDIGTVKLTVVVLDVNDNPPKFATQRQLLGVPTTAKADYLVTKLMTMDADTENNSKTLYKVIGGDSTVFGVAAKTGEVITLSAVTKSKKKVFELVVMAMDEDDPTLNDNITLKIIAVDPNDRLVLTANLSITDFTEHREHLISEMGVILGLNVQLEYTTPHKQPDGSVDLRSTDIFFHGINKTTDTVIPYDIMLELLKSHDAELRRLFGMELLEVEQVPTDTHIDPSEITVSQSALICLAVLIFFGSLLAIFFILYSWQRTEEGDNSEGNSSERALQVIELESIRSRHSNRPDAAAAFVNHVYDETDLNSGKQIQQKKEGSLNGLELHNGPVHRDNIGTHSMAKNGIDSAFLHSSHYNKPGCNYGKDAETVSSQREGSNVAKQRKNKGKPGVQDEKYAEGRRTGICSTDIIADAEVNGSKSAGASSALVLLDWNASPIKRPDPRLTSADMDLTTPGAPVIVFNEQNNSSETESTTDILDVNDTLQNLGTKKDMGGDIQEINSRKEENDFALEKDMSLKVGETNDQDESTAL